MKSFVAFAFVLLTVTCAAQRAAHHLLVETEGFQHTGGWVIDPQFVEQMGSPFLLAHGMGSPVSDAVTRIKLPAKGIWHVYARTRNWAGDFGHAPGVFKLKVNNDTLSHVLGNEGFEWHWQYAGSMKLPADSLTLSLCDLTGFEGRCDAIFFTTRLEAPPSQHEALASWRRNMLNETDEPETVQDFDFVVAGGGIAGCAAAIAAANQGLRVALIHDRPVTGGNASGEIRVHTLGITWHYDSLLRQINTRHWPNGSPEALTDDRKRQQYMESVPGITLFMNWRAYTANVSDNQITSIDARHTASDKTIRFTAPLFADCTGDGWIGFWAGAEYMYGREDSITYGENWPLHGELWSPATADNRVMGSSLLWRSVATGSPTSFPEVPWAMETARDHAAINGEWYWEFSRNDLHQIDDAEQIRDHMFKAIYGSFYNAKQKPEYANYSLEWVSYLSGKRESRRLIGDYVYTFTDEKLMREFPDAVVMEKREVDVHYQQNLKDPAKPDFLSEALFYRLDHYYIPYRCLYSRNISNLFMAGRCFSCSHVGLGGPRVMNTTGQMGAAVGYAAALCKRHACLPRGIGQNYIEELKQIIYNQ